MTMNARISKDGAARIAAEIAREKEAARAEAKRQLPAARADFSEWTALFNGCSADMHAAMRSADAADAGLRAAKRSAVRMTSADAVIAYARAKEDVSNAALRVEIMRERLDDAISGRDGCAARIVCLEAEARGYDLHTMKVAGNWLNNSDVDRLVRRAGLDRAAVDVLRRIAAGQEVANGPEELRRAVAAISEAESR